MANLGVSNTIRGAVGNWSKTIATELAPFGITVNNILPGATETERLNTIINNKSGKLNVERDEIENEMFKQAAKAVGANYKDINHGDMTSKELDSTNKISPVAKIKKNKYGV